MLTLDIASPEEDVRSTAHAPIPLMQRAPEAPAHHCEWRPLADLHSIVPQWKALAARTLEPNIFYEPAFALPATKVFGRHAGAVLVWSDDTQRHLVGLFPACVEHHRYGIPLPLLVGWTHPYAPFGVPLVDAIEAEAVVSAWLDFIAQARALPHIMLLPYLRQDGPFSAVLYAAVATHRGRAATYDLHARAMLAPATDRNNYVDGALAPKKRRELRRQAKHLSAHAPLAFIYANDPPAVAAGLNEFLRLESTGWKGRVGTAAANDPATRAFLVSAVEGLASSKQTGIARLMLGENTIVVGIVLRSGSSAWFWKIAYDEAFAAASPGVQLTLGLTEHLLADATFVQADSCATADHPMMDHLWRERLSVGDLLITPSPSGAFTVASRLEHMRRDAITTLRSIKRKLRG